MKYIAGDNPKIIAGIEDVAIDIDKMPAVNRLTHRELPDKIAYAICVLFMEGMLEWAASDDVAKTPEEIKKALDSLKICMGLIYQTCSIGSPKEDDKDKSFETPLAKFQSQHVEDIITRCEYLHKKRAGYVDDEYEEPIDDNMLSKYKDDLVEDLKKVYQGYKQRGLELDINEVMREKQTEEDV